MLKLHSHKGLVHITLGNIIGAILTGGFWLSLASFQEASQYGKINYEISVSSLATFACILGLNTAVTTFSSKGSDKFAVQANQVILITSVISAAAVALLIDWHLAFFVIGMSFWMMAEYELIGRKAYKEYAIVNIGTRAAQLIIAIALYHYLGLFGIIIGFTIPYFIFAYRYFISVKSFDFRAFQEVRKSWKFIGHAYSFNLSSAFLMYFDKLLIGPLFGYAILGHYQFGLQFLLFIGMVPISFYQYLLSQGSTHNGKNKTRVHYIGIFAAVGIALAVFFVSPTALRILFPHFVESLDAIRIMSFGIIPMMIASMLNSKFFTLLITKYILFGSLIYLAIQSLLVLVLGYSMGINGLAISITTALSAQAVFLYIVDRKIARVSSPVMTHEANDSRNDAGVDSF